MDNPIQRIITIVGPTASGKSALGNYLATRYSGAIISADSRQVYQELNIGTNKPTIQDRQKIPHFLVDFIPVSGVYNAALFANDATKVISDLQLKNITPIIVGGTGLYIQALENGFDEMPRIPDAVRTKLDEELVEKGLGFLVTELKMKDPESANTIDLKNKARVKRALEVIRTTGKPFSSFKLKSPKNDNRSFQLLKIGLEVERSLLYKRIDERVLEMINQGLVAEVESLWKLENAHKMQSLQTIGYKEIISYLNGDTTLQNAISKLQQNTRNYAKRQLTWFRRDTSIQWFKPDRIPEIIAYIETQTPGNPPNHF